MRPASTLFAVFVTILVSRVAPASAQPTITAPGNGQVFSAGPDYATDMLHDPWDFSNVDDVSEHPDEYLGWSQTASAHVNGRGVFLNGGRFVAQSNSIDPMLGLLYAGQHLTVPTGRDGGRFPIDTGRYRKIAAKLTVAGGSGPIAVHWFFGPRGIDVGSTAIGPSPANTDQVLSLDLGAGTAGGTPYVTQPFVRGLRLDPTSTNGASVSVDWVRLTSADNAVGSAMMSVQATNCATSYTLFVIDGAGTSTSVASGAGGTISPSFNYGIFPPGAYTLRLTCNNGSTDHSFIINDPPRLAVTAPSTTSGADYAASVLGNPWDMDDAADVAGASNINPLQLVPSPEGGNMLRGVNVSAPGNPGAQGDPNFFLLGPSNNATPIATSRYRYLTFAMQLEYPFDMGNGSVARIVYGSRSNFDGSVATTTKDILVLPGRSTYTIDMGSLAPGQTLEPGPLSEPWSLRSVRFLRFDPHEFGYIQVPFSVDSVKLTAADEVTLGATYTFRWSLADGDANGARAARVFLDTDTNVANGATLIGQGIDAGSGAWGWQANGVAPGLYYVYLEVTDTHGAAANTQGIYSTGLLRVLSPSADGAVVSLLQPQSGGTFYSGYTLGGCAYHPAATSGTGIDEVIAYALGGPTGTAVNILGTLSTGEWGTPLVSGLPCPGGTGPSATSGFAVSNIFGLQPGNWTFRVLARNTLTGDFEEALATNVAVDWRSPPARNLRLVSTVGNGVTLAWDPPDGGRPITAYRIEVATNPSFTPLAAQVQVPPNVTSGSGTLSNRNWFVRIVTESAYTNAGLSSNVLNFVLPGGIAPGPVSPPGAPTLTVVQSQVNPITLSWTAGAGGAPSQYVLQAGTAPGASNLGAFNVTGQSGITAAAPTGTPIYARLVASNGAGSATSNEISFAVGGAPPPGVPTMNPPSVSGRNVTLSWSSGAGATSYIVVARIPGSSAIVATLPGQTATSAFVPNVPPGSYRVSVVAVNAAGPSAESNAVTVNVP